ncbi:AAA family ATPase [Trichlorobacter ammonificans]|uniref:Cobyrinic acid a,c-diamide synthase family protein n=1 Tax=Trichlorobacter ammonificans TaxID=2916410 RepID=A0ABN8HJZ8_9BACT|nr:AAA family ATPase [Trichlorobacter ammonificans]CAH2030312.1 Cobyrinic acid a,c-diamide synthase family protein [Trichlorobacter ammonificans]
MCRKIFIGATGQHCGKTTISLSLMHLARKRYARVGFMKPIGPKCIEYRGMIMDKDAAMMASVYGLDQDAPFMSPMTLTAGTTRRFLDGTAGSRQPRQLILDACTELEKRHDFLIIEGAGHGGVGSVVGANNAQVAAMLDAPVLMITGGGIGNVIDAVELNLPLYEREHARVKVIMANKLVASKREESLAYLTKAFQHRNLLVTSAFDYSRTLADPTLQHVAELLQLPLHGDPADKSRICHTIQIGAASSQKVIEGLGDSTLLIVTSSRDELIVTASALHHIPEFRTRLAGLIVAGHAPMSTITQRILEDSMIPHIRIEETTADVFALLREHVSKIGPDDTEKIELINSTAEKYINFDAIDAMLG